MKANFDRGIKKIRRVEMVRMTFLRAMLSRMGHHTNWHREGKDYTSYRLEILGIRQPDWQRPTKGCIARTISPTGVGLIPKFEGFVDLHLEVAIRSLFRTALEYALEECEVDLSVDPDEQWAISRFEPVADKLDAFPVRLISEPKREFCVVCNRGLDDQARRIVRETWSGTTIAMASDPSPIAQELLPLFMEKYYSTTLPLKTVEK